MQKNSWTSSECIKFELSHDRVAPNTDQLLARVAKDLKTTFISVQGFKGKYNKWAGQEFQQGNRKYKMKRKLQNRHVQY